jgi:multiple sugar transport system permease protein
MADVVRTEPTRLLRRTQQARARTLKRALGWSVFYVALSAGAIAMVLPLIWMVSGSLKEPDQIFAIPVQWVPDPARWQNYSEALSSAPFGRYFFNSIFIGTCTTLSVLFFASLAGFGFAKYTFIGRNVLFIAILSTLMVPFQVIMVPLYLLMRDFHWLNTYLALIVPGGMSAFGIFLMRQFILTLPDELFDAARIDGSGEFGTYVRLVLPLSKPPLAALAIFTFLDSWNSLLWPLIVVNDDNLRPLALGLSEFQSRYGTSYHYLLAASTVAVIPVIVLFVLLQKQFIQGIVLTGLKG